jgi:hypothetical protein
LPVSRGDRIGWEGLRKGYTIKTDFTVILRVSPMEILSVKLDKSASYPGIVA